ncbi:hypothetical protein Bbelb_297910 [Branchiostoma belcheri]|nr:hypothetical protein Bbelb_297910 [Branchiostoma belcheri]
MWAADPTRSFPSTHSYIPTNGDTPLNPSRCFSLRQLLPKFLVQHLNSAAPVTGGTFGPGMRCEKVSGEEQRRAGLFWQDGRHMSKVCAGKGDMKRRQSDAPYESHQERKGDKQSQKGGEETWLPDHQQACLFLPGTLIGTSTLPNPAAQLPLNRHVNSPRVGGLTITCNRTMADDSTPHKRAVGQCLVTSVRGTIVEWITRADICPPPTHLPNRP